MSAKLIQFNSGDHVLGNKNAAEALVTTGDVVFNESYIVVGDSLEAAHIHATYDLDVIADLYADSISVNGDLFVKGNVEADELICHGIFICTGEVKVKKITLESYAVADSIVGEELFSGDHLFIRSTVDTNSNFESEGLVVAGEGILGDGSFSASAAIANEYFEFRGKNKTKVFEISEMEFTQEVTVPGSVEEAGPKDIEGVISLFKETLENHLEAWKELDEEEFVSKFREIIAALDDLHFSDRLLDTVIELSYEREITNFKDYLSILGAKNVFPKGLAEYETISPVLDDLFNDATFKIDKMEYSADNAYEFACSLLILDLYQDQLPISMEEGADKIFSSVGLRYSTVEHAWRSFNG